MNSLNIDNTYYRIVNGIKYINTFPDEWINNEHDNCGPKVCVDCLNNGTYRAIFVGYCTRCAEEYNFERGNGMLTTGKEMLGDLSQSVWRTYLQNINLELVENRNDWAFEYATILNNLYSNDIELEERNILVDEYINRHNNYRRFPLVLFNNDEELPDYEIMEYNYNNNIIVMEDDINVVVNVDDDIDGSLPELITDSDITDEDDEINDADSEEYYFTH